MDGERSGTEGKDFRAGENVHAQLGSLNEASPDTAAVAGEAATEAPSAEAGEAEDPRAKEALLSRMLDQGTPEAVLNLFRNGMSPDQLNEQGSTALMAAAGRGKVELVQGLLGLESPPNVNTVVMHQGRAPITALDAARQSGKPEIVEMLLARGARTGREIQSDLESTSRDA